MLVGTPIGNLGDLSPRAVQALREADVVFCEDTRIARRLLSAAGIPAPELIAMHAHNEAAAAERAVSLAAGGRCVAVTSDAGMPGISDPGERVVCRALEACVTVEAVPGPSAGLLALVLSGLPTSRFCFEGFLPRKGALRAARLASLAAESRTAVLFESPQRVSRTVADLLSACGGERRLVLCRELTKLHEQVWRGNLAEAPAWLEGAPKRGEWVLVLEGGSSRLAPAQAEVEAELRSRLACGLRPSEAAAQVASSLGVPRREAYEIAVALGRRPLA